MILIVIMITKMFQKIEGYGWGMKKRGKNILKKPRHEVTLVAQWRQMPHIKNDDQFSQRSFFFKSELEDLAPGNKTSDLSLIFSF